MTQHEMKYKDRKAACENGFFIAILLIMRELITPVNPPPFFSWIRGGEGIPISVPHPMRAGEFLRRAVPRIHWDSNY